MIYEDFMLRYAKNQLNLNPNYRGETIYINGEPINTTVYVSMIISEMPINKTKSVKHEIINSYITNIDLFEWNKLPSTNFISLLYTYGVSTLNQRKNIFEQSSGILLKEIKKRKVRNPDTFIEGETLNVNILQSDIVYECYEFLLGLEKSSFLMNETYGTHNGNILDYYDKFYNKLKSIGITYSTVGNLLRSVGLLYSDYSQYIEKGILVSIGANDAVYVEQDRVLYCMSIDKFEHCLNLNCNFKQLKEEYEKIYSLKDLKIGTYREI